MEMRCVAIREFGGPEVLVPSTAPVPQLEPEEVLIRVVAAGVNRPDVVQRQGFYAPPPGASQLPGLEVAGEVVETGSRVERWRRGDRVCALLAGGGYAEYASAPAGQCLPLPEGATFVEAASLPETAFTVWHNLFQRGGLQRGESLLVHGGSSGIGVIAIQLARARGARVIATAGSAEKCAACLQLGAERAVNYREEDFVAAVAEFTGRRGVDVILDMVGGGYLQRGIEAAAVEGRIVQIATLAGPKTELNLMHLMLKRLTLTGSTLRARSIDFKSALAAQVERNVWPLIEAGMVKNPICRVFALEQAGEAHALMESSAHIGKIVLKVAD